MYTLSPKARFSSSVGNGLFNSASLDLHFAKTKSLVDATTGSNLIDFTRASSGTYVGSDGLIKTAVTNEPRFDHDPTTGESLGLLVEESRTNLLEYSEDISQWSSTTGGSPTITPNADTAPDGTNTATLIENTGARAFIGDATSYTSGTTYTFSGYFKANDGDQVAILLYSVGETSGFWNSETSNVATTFNLTNGTFTTFPSAVAPTTSSITDAGNGWWRCSITATATATSGGSNQLIRNTSETTEGIYAWGYQIEVGSFPTSYIPTEGSEVTRAADVASISGSNFSSWYRQDEGTLYTSALSSGGPSTLRRVAFGSDGTTSNRWGISITTSNYPEQLVSSGGSLVVNSSVSTVPATGRIKVAAGFKANDFAVSANSSAVVADSGGNMPVGTDRLDIGKLLAGGELNGTIRRITYWPQRLPDSTLQTITQ